jgi:hypothetical protein
MSKPADNKRSVGVFLHVTRVSGVVDAPIPVHSHEESWRKAMALMDDPKVFEVSARVKQ